METKEHTMKTILLKNVEVDPGVFQNYAVDVQCLLAVMGVFCGLTEQTAFFFATQYIQDEVYSTDQASIDTIYYWGKNKMISSVKARTGCITEEIIAFCAEDMGLSCDDFAGLMVLWSMNCEGEIA
jgi:hypothetical protein